jgi:hypothetical protein
MLPAGELLRIRRLASMVERRRRRVNDARRAASAGRGVWQFLRARPSLDALHFPRCRSKNDAISPNASFVSGAVTSR